MTVSHLVQFQVKFELIYCVLDVVNMMS